MGGVWAGHKWFKVRSDKPRYVRTLETKYDTDTCSHSLDKRMFVVFLPG